MRPRKIELDKSHGLPSGTHQGTVEYFLKNRRAEQVVQIQPEEVLSEETALALGDLALNPEIGEIIENKEEK